MSDTSIFTSMDKPTFLQKDHIVEFLYQHLDQYGDPKEYIQGAVDYSLSDHPGEGGFLLVEYGEADRVLGAVVINKTGMSGYIPENILVYISVHEDARGTGLGKKLIHKAQEMAKGDIALHVEPENPARHLYEKTGFSNKYLEYRWEKEQGDPKHTG
ncbi:MAG: GNAT family N-acetyltransferase [Flavobacteriales bacterium]